LLGHKDAAYNVLTPSMPHVTLRFVVYG